MPVGHGPDTSSYGPMKTSICGYPLKRGGICQSNDLDYMIVVRGRGNKTHTLWSCFEHVKDKVTDSTPLTSKVEVYLIRDEQILRWSSRGITLGKNFPELEKILENDKLIDELL